MATLHKVHELPAKPGKLMAYVKVVAGLLLLLIHLAASCHYVTAGLQS